MGAFSFRKWASRLKSSRKVLKPHAMWAHLALENLDQRILPSVTASLNRGVLDITPTDHQPNQVVIHQANNLIAVTNSGQSVGTFAANQVVLILFQDGPASSTLTNQTAVPAKQLHLFDAAPLTTDQFSNVTATIDAHGNYDVVVAANSATIGSFSVTGLQMEFTNQASTVHAQLSGATFGLNQATIAGSVAADGSYSLSGTANASLAGFTLSGGTVTLNGSGLTFAGQLGLAGGTTVNLAGSVNAQGRLDLTGTSTVVVDGFTLPVNFELTNTSLAASTTLTIGGQPLALSGTVDNQGHYSLSGAGQVTLAGFGLNANFTLTNTSLTAAGNLSIGGNTVHLAGTVDKQGHYSLSGTANATIGGYQLTPSFTLTNTSLAVAAGVMIPNQGTIALSGTVDQQGRYTLAGSANVTIAGYALNPTFTLTNTSLALATAVTVPSVGTLNLNGTVDSQGNFSLAGSANVTMAGYTVSPTFTLTNTSFTGAANVTVPGVGPVAFTATVSSQGNFSLTGTANVTLAGYPLNATATLTNTSLTFAADVAVPNVATAHLTGTVDNQGNLAMAGTANITLAGYTLNPSFTLTKTSLSVTAGVPIPNLGDFDFTGTVDNQGNFSLTRTQNITIDGYVTNTTLTLTNTSLSAASALTIPTVGTINLAGTIDSQGDYSVTGTYNLTIAGYSVVPSFTLTNTSLAVTANVIIPNVGPVGMTGTVDNQGNFSLTRTGDITIAGYTLNATMTLSNTKLSVTADLSVPSAGVIPVTGWVTSSGQFSLTGTIKNLPISFINLSNVSVNLTNTGLTLAGQASNVPVLGTVTFTGTVAGGSYTFTATVPQATVLGFTLTNITATFANGVLTMHAHAPNLPVVGSGDFSGTVTASTYVLTATFPTVTVDFVTFTNVSLTLTPSGLAFRGTTVLPVVGSTLFTGTMTYSGKFTLTASPQAFTLLGFVTFTNPKVTLTWPTKSLTVSAQANLAGIGWVSFTGKFFAGGKYSFDGSASLTVAGFTLGTSRLHTGNEPGDSSDGITIGPFTTPPLPTVGPVTLMGSYKAGGQFSFWATVHPTPPIIIGGIPFNQFTVGLTNNSLTFGAGAGFAYAGFQVAEVYFQGTIFTNGDFTLIGTVDTLTIAGFNDSHGVLTLKKTGSQVNLTVDASVNMLLATVELHGFLNFNTGQFSLTGSQNFGVAGFSFSSASFTVDNLHGLNVQVHSHTNIVNIGAVDFDGTLAKSGSSYVVSLRGTASFQVAGFQLAGASLLIDNTHLAISAHLGFAGFVSASFTGSMDSHGNFDLRATAQATLAGYGGYASLHLTNTLLTVSASLNVVVATVAFNGYFKSNGQFQLTGSRDVQLGGFSAVTGMFTLTNSGVSVQATVNLYAVQVTFSGAIDLSGHYALTGTAVIGLGGFQPVTGQFILNNNGALISASVNVFVAQVAFSGSFDHSGHYTLTGSASVGLAGFPVANASFTLTNSGAAFSVSVNVFVATVNFSGSVDNRGNFSLTGSANASFAGFNGSGSFTLTNSGVSFSGSVNIFVATVNVSGSISSSGAFQFVVGVGLNFAGFGGNGTVTLSNSGVAISASVNVFVATVNFSGSVDSSGNFSLTGSASANFVGFGATASFTLTNNGVSISSSVNVFVATVNFTGSVDSSGNFRLTGSASAGFAGFGATASFTLTNSGVSISSSVNVFVATVSFSGSVDSSGNFRLTGSASAGFAGFNASASFTLTNNGVAISSSVNVFVATVSFTGSVDSSGNFSLTGSATAGFAGFNASASFTLANNGVAISSSVNVFVATVNFSGSVDSSGNFSLTGSASANFAGFSATASFTLTNTGVSISSSVNVFVATVNFSGSVDSSGNFSLTGSASASFAGFGATASFTLTNSGVSISSSVNVIVATVNFTGSVDSSGNFSLTGSASAGFAGFNGSGSFTLSNSGVSFSGSVNVLVASINVSGSISSSGSFQFTATANLSFAGYTAASGSVTLSNSGVSVSATLDVGIMGVHMGVSGAVHSDGSFSFSSTASVGFSAISGSLSLTLTNSGLSAQFHAGVDLSTGINFGAWSLTIGVSGSFDVGFAVDTSGGFSANGNFTVTAYAGISLSVGIGFSINNSQITIKTGDIGFSVWGIGFHPFSDITINY